MIEGHGDDLYLYPKGTIRTNFSSNIHTNTDIDGLKTFLAQHLDCITTYPEPEPFTLEQQIAIKEGIQPENVVVTNGATEAIYLLAQAFHGNKSTIIQPTFSEYASACRMHRHKICDNGDIVWLCNPNNPTGEVMSREQLADSLALQDILYIIDQAYEDYTSEPLLTDDEAVCLGNVALIHSMTKRYGIPGLRLGYVVADTPIIQRIREVRQPWSVNAMALCAGQYLINQPIPINTEKLLVNAQALWHKLNDIKEIEMQPTQTNFMLGRISTGTAAELKMWLISKYGILIRDASNFEGLSPQHFRIAAQEEKDNNILVNAIKEYIHIRNNKEDKS